MNSLRVNGARQPQQSGSQFAQRNNHGYYGTATFYWNLQWNLPEKKSLLSRNTLQEQFPE
jgi:hypothetical protein